uniref:Uncharacterized protein n=1 Tax=Setaria italica TaxID=4555 RepID=K3YP39_SETIT
MLAAAGTSGRVEHMDMQQQPFPLTKWWVRGHDTTTLLCVLEKKKKVIAKITWICENLGAHSWDGSSISLREN